MKAVSVKPMAYLPNGKTVVDCLIVADDTPAILPTTGADVEGMSADMIFAPFSILYVTATAAEKKVYVANENGSFVEQW